MATSKKKSRAQSSDRSAEQNAKERASRQSGAERHKPSGYAPLFLAAIAIAALVIAAYGNGFGNGFVWDDHQQILNNPAVQAGAPLGRIFSSDVRFDTHTQGVESSDYRPLQMLTYRLLMASFGANATAFHVCSLLFAIACALAAFVVFYQLTRSRFIAFAAATLFALSPIHTEAVNWIASLPELGFSLFFLLSLAFFLKYRNIERQSSPQANIQRARTAYAASSWSLFAIALLWKETAIVLPLLIIAFALLLHRGSTDIRHRVLTATQTSAPYWAVAALYLSVRWVVLGSIAKAPRSWDLTFSQQTLNQLALMEQYWAKLAWPFSLNAYYVFSPLRSLSSPHAVIVLLLALAATAALGSPLRLLTKSRITDAGTASDDPQPSSTLQFSVFAICWVFITLLPAMGLGALGRNPFTERYLYLPSVGFCLLITLLAAWLLQRLPQPARRYAGGSLLALAAIAFFCITVQRNPDWKDDITLFRATLRSSPDAPFVHNMVATAESADSAQADDAAGNYQEAVDLALKQTPPDHVAAVVAYRGLAWIDGSRGQFAQALSLLDRANSIAPQDADTDGERGLILAQAGRGKEAMPFLQRALAAQPDNENVLSAMGLISNEEEHDPQRASAFFLQALASHRAEDDFAASQHNNLATVYAEQGNYSGAEAQLRTAIIIFPSDPEFHANLASALAAQGQFNEARQEAQTAAQLAPQVPALQELLQKIQQAAAGH